MWFHASARAPSTSPVIKANPSNDCRSMAFKGVQEGVCAGEDFVMPQFNGRWLPASASLMQVAAWTPSGYESTAKVHGWIEFTDDAQHRSWLAYRTGGNHGQNALVSIKSAAKGINGAPTEIDVISATAMCGPNGSAPNYLEMVTLARFAPNHAPMEMDGPQPSMAIPAESNLAHAIIQICKHLHDPPLVQN